MVNRSSHTGMLRMAFHGRCLGAGRPHSRYQSLLLDIWYSRVYSINIIAHNTASSPQCNAHAITCKHHADNPCIALIATSIIVQVNRMRAAHKMRSDSTGLHCRSNNPLFSVSLADAPLLHHQPTARSDRVVSNPAGTTDTCIDRQRNISQVDRRASCIRSASQLTQAAGAVKELLYSKVPRRLDGLACIKRLCISAVQQSLHKCRPGANILRHSASIEVSSHSSSDMRREAEGSYGPPDYQ